MRGSVIRNTGKSRKTRKSIEESAELGAINAIMCMIEECSEKAAAIRAPIEIGSRLVVIAESARSIQADIKEAFEKVTV